MSLEEAVHQALANNPRVTASEQAVTAAEHGVTAARAGYLPRVDLKVGARATDNPGQAFLAKINQGAATAQDFRPGVVNDPDTTSDVATTLELRQPLYQGGAIGARVSQARAERAGAEEGLDSSRLEVALGATRSYLDVLLAQARQRVTDQALKAAREHLRMARDRFQTGSTIKADVLKARTRVSELEERRLSLRNAEALNKSSLNQVLGRSLGAPVDTEERLKAELPPRPGPLRELTERALAAHPEVQRSRHEARKARAAVEETEAALLPHVGLQARVMDHRDADSDQSWLVGAQLEWRLLGGGRWAQTDAATAKHFAARSRLTSTARRIRLAVKKARLNLENARSRLETVHYAVESAEESLRTTEDRYEQGAARIVDLLDAELALHQARLRRVKALYDLRLSHAKLQKATGRLPVLARTPGQGAGSG
jgi:TolC family type I secretion outer membrane protein